MISSVFFFLIHWPKLVFEFSRLKCFRVFYDQCYFTGDPIEPTGNVSRVIEENKRLHSMLEEKDRRIHLLEFKVNQLMKDTRNFVEENAHYQKENSTLVRALSTLTTKDGSSSSKK